MSSSQPTDTQDHSNGARYAPTNWWGSDRDGTDESDQPDRQPNDQAVYVAHQILHEVAPKLCGRSLQLGLEIELTDPCIRPPTDTVRDQRHRKRYNPVTGYISGGESTWVQLGDLPAQEWREVIEVCLGLWRARDAIGDRESDYLRELARELKADQDISDREALTRLVRRVQAPGPADSDRLDD